MEDTYITKVKEIIGPAKKIIILPRQKPNQDHLGAAIALLSSLRKMGKDANIILEKKPKLPWFLLTEQTENPKKEEELIITTERNISKISYEKDKKGLRLLLKSKERIRREDIFFERTNGEENNIRAFNEITDQKIDLVITLGIQEREETMPLLRKNGANLVEPSFLNIDNSPLNENFGEINLVSEGKSISGIVFDLLKSLDESLIDNKIATYLLSGFVFFLGNFQNVEGLIKSIPTTDLLLEKGADYQMVIHENQEKFQPQKIKLLGRFLEKLDFLPGKDLYFSSLRERDFKETKTSSKDLAFIIEKVRAGLKIPSLLLLWEGHSSHISIKGIFYSNQKDKLREIKNNFQGISRGDGIMFLSPKSNLLEAEKEILKLF